MCEDIQNTPPPKKKYRQSIVFFYAEVCTQYYPPVVNVNLLFFSFPTQISSQNKTPWGLKSRVEAGVWVWAGWCIRNHNRHFIGHAHELLFGPLARRRRALGEGRRLCTLKLLFCLLLFVFCWRPVSFLGPGLPSRSPRAKRW